MKYNPSEEQAKIFKFIRCGIGNAFIEAFAGTGKSTTLLGCLENIKPTNSVLMIAHNVDIARHLRDEIRKQKIRDMSSDKNMTRVLTYHSLGYHIIQENLGKLNLDKMPEINDRKYVNYINANIEELCPSFSHMSKSNKASYKSSLMFLIDFCRHNINQSTKDVEKTIRHFKLHRISNEPEAIVKCLKWGKNNLKEIDFQDMLWLPYELRLQTKWFLSDFVFVDEAQDTSIAQFELFKKCIKRNTRYVAVGDEFQTINMWCGSDKDSFKKFGTFGNRVQRFSLTKSFRCGKNIIRHANRIVPKIEAADNNQDGVINFNANLEDVKPGDMVLCRNTAPLMSLYMKFIKSGKKAYIQGEEKQHYGLLNLAKSFEANSVAELSYEAQKLLVEHWENIASEFGETLEEASTNESIVNEYDNLKTLLSIAGYCHTMEELYTTIENVQFRADDKDFDAIKLSTIHRAKGLEKDRVFILHPELIPSKFAKTDWEIESEKNLEYVMITRAISSLNYINEYDESNKPPIDPISMYYKLKSIKENLHNN